MSNNHFIMTSRIIHSNLRKCLGEPNQRLLFFIKVSKQLNLEKLDDWYDVKIGDLNRILGGCFPLFRTRAQLGKVLQSTFTEHHWKLWKFGKVPRGYWLDINHVRLYLEWLAEEFNVVQNSDWRNICVRQIEMLQSGTLAHIRGLFPLLSLVYPGSHWKMDTSTSVSKAQLRVFSIVQQLFPFDEVLLNFRCVNCLHSSHSFSLRTALQRKEFDVFVPWLSLALEYHGQQHFHWGFDCGSPEIRLRQDEHKRKLCHMLGITLIEVPYWWDFSKNSLAASVQSLRPDLLLNMNLLEPPIDLQCPFGARFKPSVSVKCPDFAEIALMNADLFSAIENISRH